MKIGLWTGSWVTDTSILFSSSTALGERWDDRCVSTDLENKAGSIARWNEGDWTKTIVAHAFILIAAVVFDDLQSVSISTLWSSWAVLSIASTNVLDTASGRVNESK